MPSAQTILEQYKAYIADVGNIGSRYATMQGFYSSIVAGLLAVIAIKDKAGTVAIVEYLNWVTFVICCFLVAICWLWHDMLAYYQKLFGAKITLLKEMEKAGKLVPLYAKEFKLIGGASLMEKERLFPKVLGLAAALPGLASAAHSLHWWP